MARRHSQKEWDESKDRSALLCEIWERSGATQAVMAECVGLSTSTVSLLLDGNRFVTEDRAAAMALAMGCDLDRVMELGVDDALLLAESEKVECERSAEMRGRADESLPPFPPPAEVFDGPLRCWMAEGFVVESETTDEFTRSAAAAGYLSLRPRVDYAPGARWYCRDLDEFKLRYVPPDAIGKEVEMFRRMAKRARPTSRTD